MKRCAHFCGGFLDALSSPRLCFYTPLAKKEEEEMDSCIRKGRAACQESIYYSILFYISHIIWLRFRVRKEKSEDDLETTS